LTHSYASAFPLVVHPDIAVTTRRTLARQASDLVLRPSMPSRYLLRRADGLSRAQRWAGTDEDDDDDDFVVQYLNTFLRTRTFLGNAARSVLMTAARCLAGKVHGGDDTAVPMPGRGVAASGPRPSTCASAALVSIKPSATATIPPLPSVHAHEH
jgi:hypothetical protein